MTDVLSELEESLVAEFCQIIAKELPISMHIYCFIETCARWRTDPNINARLLYYKQNMESGIFVGLLKSGSRTVSMCVYALGGYETLFERVLNESSLIPWHELPLIQGTLLTHADILEDVIRRKGLDPVLYVDTTLQVIPFDVAKNIEIKCPDNVYIAPLERNDLDYLYDIWMLRDIYTIEELYNTSRLNFGYGVFEKDSGTLLAWAMQSHYGGVGMLQTREGHARKGYARLICSYVTKKLADLPIKPHSLVKADNIVSKKLFWSIGYEEVASMKYFKISRLSS